MTGTFQKVQVRPTDMCMADSMPFQQHWECRVTWPLEDVLHDKFFLPFRQNIRAGDQITICRYDGLDPSHRSLTLLEIATVRVVRSDGSAESIPLAVVGGVLRLDGSTEGQPTPEYRVQRGYQGRFKVMRGDEVVQEFGSKQEADAELAKRLAA